MYKIIIADDEVWIGFGIKKLIQRSGIPFQVVGEAPNGIRAYQMVKELEPDILISDIRMPGLNGLELMQKLTDEKFSGKVIFISGYADFEYARMALKMGAFDYLLKPVDEENLVAVLERFLAFREDNMQERQKQSMDIKFEDTRIQKIMDIINRQYRNKISLGELAEGCGLSIGHLSTLIKKETGMSFTECITEKRMEDAKNLLGMENLSIDEVAEEVGYNDYFYFTKAFKKYTGVSPSVYRKNL